MKRMTENAISYYNIKPEDITNIINTGVVDNPTFKYTPSTEFIEVLKEFKAVLRANWEAILPAMIEVFGTKLSMLYPTNIESSPDTDDGVSYWYDSSAVGANTIRPAFYKQNGTYYIVFNK